MVGIMPGLVRQTNRVNSAMWFVLSTMMIASCVWMQGSVRNMELVPDEFEQPAIILEAQARYLSGFPIIISVTFSNESTETRFFDLPEMNLLGVPDSISLRLEPIRGGVGLSTSPSSYRAGVRRLTLEPGESRQMGLELSNFGINIQPGTYRVTLALHVGKHARRSNPVTIEFVKPTVDDAAEAIRLRRLGISPTDTGAWAPFLKNNWNTVTVSRNLSQEAMRQLGLHLFLHRALYGPTRVAQLDVSPLREISGPVLRAEAALLEFEILTIRNDAGAAGSLREAILESWPALRFRVERLAEEKGLLTRGRKLFGAEKEFNQPPASYPYRQ